MTLVARCHICRCQIKFLETALGKSIPCPRCRNQLSLFPFEELPTTPSSTEPHDDTPAAAAASGRYTLAGDALDVPKTPWVEPIGACALVLAGLALLCALGYSWAWLVIPLGLLGILVGLIGLLRAMTIGKYRLVFPIAAPAVCGVLVVTALLFPSFLGPTYLAATSKKSLDPTRMRVIPLVKKAGAFKADPEWVDASRAALQRGSLRLQVADASVSPLEEKASAKKKKEPVEEFLFLRLLTRQLQEDDDAEPPTLDGLAAEVIEARLSDSTGKTYAQKRVLIGTPDLTNRQTISTATVDRIFVYEPPPPGRDLRWEIPMPVPDGIALFRFTVPATMIQHHQGALLKVP